MLSYFKKYFSTNPLDTFTFTYDYKYHNIKATITDPNELQKLDAPLNNLDWTHIRVPPGINPITNEPFYNCDTEILNFNLPPKNRSDVFFYDHLNKKIIHHYTSLIIYILSIY